MPTLMPTRQIFSNIQRTSNFCERRKFGSDKGFSERWRHQPTSAISNYESEGRRLERTWDMRWYTRLIEGTLGRFTCQGLGDPRRITIRLYYTIWYTSTPNIS